MCLRPITIKNLNYGLGRKGLNWLKNTETTHIQVPCGTCSECCKRKQSFLYQRASVESDSHFVFFQTLTIAPRHMMYVDFGGQTFRFFNYWYFQCYLKNIRKHQIFGEGTKFKYIAVVEYGGEKHRPHMHVLYFVPKDDKNYEYISKERDVQMQNFLLEQKAHELFPQMLKHWRVNLNDQRDENGKKLRICSLNPKWDNLCDFRVSGKFRNFDFRAVEVSPDDSKNVCFYVSKYITKFDKWTTKLYHYLRNNARDQREFLDVWNLLRPRVFISKFFGVSNIRTKEIIQQSIEYSLNPPSGQCDTWHFVDFTTGQVRTMSPYYRSRFLSLDDRISMWMFTDNPLNTCEDDIKNVELEKRERNEERFYLLVQQRNRADECFDTVEADDLLCELV